MTHRYFVAVDGWVQGEVLTETPANPAGYSIIENASSLGAHPERYQWDGDEFVLVALELTATWDKTVITADGMDAASYGGGIPAGTSYSIQPPVGAPISGTINDGSLAVTAGFPGAFVVSLTPPAPYLAPAAQTITAEAA